MSAPVGETPEALAERIVRGMLERDRFSAWLGIEVLEVRPEFCVARMTVRDEMVNGFGVAHGGITYALADSALAFACNTHGNVTMALDNAISYPTTVHVGDVLTATAQAESTARRVAFLRVIVHNQRGDAVAIFRGTVYRTSRPFFSDDATT
jgi:acyl-CoA thioesterase